MSLPDALPLTDSELAELAAFLASCRGGRAMSLETLDGFFCALITGPELVMPSEYWPHALGGDLGEVSRFHSVEEANYTLQLLMRHWNTIVVALDRGERYSPLFERDLAHPRAGTEWGDGFMQGVNLRGELWSPVIESDDDQVRWMVLPMMILALDRERDANPEVKPLPSSHRAQLLARMTLALPKIHQYFRESRRKFSGPIRRPTPPRRPAPTPARGPIAAAPNTPKIGRNEPCPCGSGKKFKHCCGGIDAASTMH